ncbi:PfkB family carbohydrate kinase [Paenibacillus larvae]|uniref:PfkB family carbohydrate kinase n=1 Tax=Paenibacillus larvae TaxID=1464 RepID=UPI002DDD6C28|nr:PfkB family carbohydrate kinase [Paenibacillus larvae]
MGAGDSHTAACLAGLASGMSIREACLLGNEIAARVVQEQGGTVTLKSLEFT